MVATAMARPIKRLSDRSKARPVDQLIRENPEDWKAALDWWSGVGVDTVMLEMALERASVERRRYEDQIEASVDSATDRKIRRARATLAVRAHKSRARPSLTMRRYADPLMHLLKTELSPDGPPELFFGDLGEEVERAVRKYIEYLDANRPKLAAHRPDDPWRGKLVVQLAWVLRACGVPWKYREDAQRLQSKRSEFSCRPRCESRLR
jgi:hypothetical protein